MKLSDFFQGRPKRKTQVTLAGRQSAHIESDDLKGLPSVNDQAAREMAKFGWPADEERTTAEIYAAAEAIREKRPRDPVGYATGEPIEVRTTSIGKLVQVLGSGRRYAKGLGA